ncbi:MAG: LruC domain-containing protein [Candidatus Cloacimonetes bacterium]|nr:LruC domain-containing protein [Candidatus Cloacimonadota bacterium]
MTLTPTQNINYMEWLAPFNPFIYINGERGKEVHLPGFPPTESADRQYFGVGDDDSNLTEGRYYKTAINLPWAINIPTVWTYPQEQTSITEAYYFLDEWATSGGVDHTDWYIEGGSNTDESKLYYQP